VVNITGLDAIGSIAGNGTMSMFGSQQIAAWIVIAAIVIALAFIGLDIVAGVAIGGLAAIGFAFLGWLPMQETLVVVLIIWGLGFAYFITSFYGSR
jgi:hypothetical protein